MLVTTGAAANDGTNFMIHCTIVTTFPRHGYGFSTTETLVSLETIGGGQVVSGGHTITHVLNPLIFYD